ncbi:hypothetical protein [uncultured Treponema sp.]|uniref:hypothetical protein n=1 Tax=uncultured Treponema sp. TaxID=162155 RepID=UPI0025FF7820|nr:hypothetical protein [uncultured Treponema sp.]
MKKNKFFALAASFLALGFGLVGCDSGDGEDSYNEETPTIWAELEGTATTSVTAKWTFETDTLPIGEAETSIKGKKIPANSGEGATLEGGNELSIKWVAPTGTATEDTGASTGRIQASNKTASLATPENGAMLLLTTTADTNITVRAKGAGAATSARIFVIRKKGSEENLVYKDNLYSAGSKFIAFHLKNAPAGTYEIYFNGSTISEIDCNSTTTVTEPKAYSSNDNLTLSAAPTNALESLIDTHTFTLNDADGDVTASAIWTVIEGSDIATVKAGVVSAKSANSAGKVKVRARIGRFYKDSDEFEFKECEKTLAMTLIGSNMPAKDAKILNWNTSTDDGADARKILLTGVKGLDLIECSEVASISIAEPLQNIHVKETGTYTLSGGIYQLTADTAASPASEIWSIKDITGQNGGLHVKDDSTSANDKTADEATVSWATAKETTYASDTELYSVSYNVKPVSGKTPKILGISGCINGGKGAGNIYVDLYLGSTKLGRALCVKNASVDATTLFDETTQLTEESTITFKIGVVGGKKAGQSVQIQNLAMVCSE